MTRASRYAIAAIGVFAGAAFVTFQVWDNATGAWAAGALLVACAIQLELGGRKRA